MTTIYKIDDKVYDALVKQWGIVVNFDKDDEYYPIHVRFADKSFTIYTIDGRKSLGYMPTLSFTEYDFINGGFSQIRPQPEIKKDQLVYIKLKGCNEWHIRYFSHFDKYGKLWFFNDQQNSNDAKYTIEASEYSFKLPLT